MSSHRSSEPERHVVDHGAVREGSFVEAGDTALAAIDRLACSRAVRRVRHSSTVLSRSHALRRVSAQLPADRTILGRSAKTFDARGAYVEPAAVATMLKAASVDA